MPVDTSSVRNGSSAPIALFVYNRPWHAQRTVEALQKNEPAKESEFFIYSDGPKDDAANEKVGEVREYIKTISGFKQVNIIEREENYGLANSIIAGVTELCERFGRCIVLEDDLLVSPHFLEYMNEALVRYENEELVVQISGHMFPVELETETDAVFLPFTTSWGWATWERAWEHFDPLMSGYALLKRDRGLKHRFNLEGSYDYFYMLEAQAKGKIDSWAIRWYLSVFMRGGLTLFPKKNMVRNIGFDRSGAHCTTSGMRFTAELSDFRISKYPPAIEPAWQPYKICRSFLKKMRMSPLARIKESIHEISKIFV
jgi:hypothetical protein